MGMTPMKKRSRLTVSSPALEAGYESTLVPLNPDLGPESLFEHNVRLGWKPLVSNLDTLATLVLGAKELVKKLSNGTELELEGMDYLTARLRAELGTRPEEWGTESAFEKLGHVVLEIDGITANLEKLVTKHEVDQKKAKAEGSSEIQLAVDQVQRDMLVELQPIFQLFAVTSTAKTTPGDKYLAELTFLKGELAAVRAAQVAVPPPANAPARGVTWGMGSMNLTPPVPVGSSPVVAPSAAISSVMSPFMAGKIKALEESMLNIEAQLVAESVELGGVIFASRAATKAWIKAEACADMAYVFFLDPHSFMNVGHAGGGNSAEQLGFQAAAAKAGFASAEEALVVSSYKFELPTFFGKETKDSRKLPVCPTADAWDSRDGFTGVRYEFRKMIHSTRKEQLSNATLYLTGDGLSVAKHMIQASFSFLETMEAWISQQYNDLLGQGGSEKECWEYVCHCVREIFSCLHEARLPGRGFLTVDERPVAILWGSLQAHKKMEELTKKQFSAHPLLSHVLNLHLRQHSVRKVDHLALMNRVTFLEEELDRVKGIADKALSTANKLKK
jgi:hypothetical protein